MGVPALRHPSRSSLQLIEPRWIGLTIGAAALMTVSSAAGIWMSGIYGKETASWAAQGVAQDAVNLTLILPVLLIALWLAVHGSVRALLVAIGLLMYIVYSYVLYSFFVHFNVLFLAYVGTLGLSSWSLGGTVATMNRAALADALDRERRHTMQAAYLVLSGCLFGALWLRAIVPALWTGIPPRDIVDVGLTVNPVHVLDLAFVLPAMMVVGVLLYRRRTLGLLFAVPLLTFAAAMGAAIIAMAAVMDARGLAEGGGVIVVMTLMVSISLLMITTLLRRSSP